MKKILLLMIFINLVSCKNQDNIDRELSLKEKELELKERELNIREKEAFKKVEVVKKSSLSELFKEKRNSIFLVVTKNSNSTSQGSGFFIREDGLGVSNYHVFEGAEEALIRTNNGERYMISEIVNFDKEKDFVVFKITNSTSNTFTPLNFAKKIPEVGEECFAIGNPKGLEQTLSKGIISGHRGDYIQSTAQITHGSSGGALFDQNGDVIGITTMGHKEADLNFALNTINFDFFERNNIRREPIISENNLGYQKRATLIIEEYFTALYRNDFDALNYLFADKFTRFYNEFGFTKYQAINDHQNYSKTYPSPKSEIDYRSIKMNKDYDGSILVNLNLDFTIKKSSWSKSRTYTYAMFIKLDKDYKINSVFTNIID